ncbi:MAG TPA: FAD binding domain-containing protein [Terracidiphilus sp.]|jgi:CO/xanthine dehydrogenase FAD-binding subunit
MRGNALEHQLVAPGSLNAVLDLIASAPGQWTPIAGGTELMVAFAAGRLSAGKLVSLWDIKEIRFIKTNPESLTIGAGTTFSDLRSNPIVATEFPLLDEAASWIGAIANQTRATVGGNLVNGSPAADSSPALLVYDAEVELISIHGKRRLPYSQFHTGYKQNAMTADELMFAVHLPRRFSGHRHYIRKVGTRRAMAISKVALAAAARMNGQRIDEIRVAAASLAPFPARLVDTETVLAGKVFDTVLIESARQALLAEVQPIDDIRSTAEYRKQVGANLLREFLLSLQSEPAIK